MLGRVPTTCGEFSSVKTHYFTKLYLHDSLQQ